MRHPADLSYAEADGPKGQAIVRQVAGLLWGLAEMIAEAEMIDDQRSIARPRLPTQHIRQHLPVLKSSKNFVSWDQPGDTYQIGDV